MFKYEDLLFTVVWVLVAVGFGAGLALVCNRFDDPRCKRRAFRFALWSILAVFVLASAGIYVFKVRRCRPASRPLCQEILFEWWYSNGFSLLFAVLVVPRLCGWCGKNVGPTTKNGPTPKNGPTANDGPTSNALDI